MIVPQKWLVRGAAVVSAMPKSNCWHDSLLAVGASNTLEGGRLAEFAEKESAEHMSNAHMQVQFDRRNV